MLAFEDVTRRFGAVRAIERASFVLERGTLTALVGPNGAGKSTLLRLAATLDAPTQGRVLVDGASGADARSRVAWMGQEPGLYEDMSVRENLAFVARFFGTERDIMRAADAFGARLDARVRALSRGERQRAALARAWLGGPLMLLDEPTTALDADAQDSAVRALLALRGERTLLVATHDRALIEKADRVLRLDGGRLA